MIKFLQHYTTKAAPPEVFEVDQEVSRSPESELYFVRLGVAGFLVDGVVLNEDYQPIVRETMAIVVTNDRRFADTGRGGEVISLDAPARASSGPGNAAAFAGQPDSIGLSEVEVAQLRSDLAEAIGRGEDGTARVANLEAELESIRADFLTVTADRDKLAGDVTALQNDLQTARGDLTAVEGLRTDNVDLAAKLKDANGSLETAAARIAELEAAAAKKSTTSRGDK